MAKKLLTHDKALALVYNTIATLRAQGKTKITVSEVAKISGVSRSTINSNQKDWIEVRDVIQNNRSSPKVKMVSDEIQEKNKWQIEASRLERELLSCQEYLLELTEDAESVYKKLLDQLHKYVYKANKVPEKMDRESKILIELQELRKQVEYYEAKIRNLEANSLQNTNMLPFIKKETIEVYKEIPKVNITDFIDVTIDALDELDTYFMKSNSPEVVYILCGNFASGKSTWISKHKALYQGTNLYFDGTNHSKTIRKCIVKHIRKIKPECKIICVRTLCDVSQCLKRNINDTRIRLKNFVSDELIRNIGKNFEEVSVNEGFDGIIISGGYLNV